MLELFRRFFKSTLGVGLTLSLLVIIALAFAAGDVASSGGFGGVAGGDRAAMVGKTRIGTAELAKQVSQGFDIARQDNPRLSIKEFLAQGGLDAVLEQVLDRTAIFVFGQKHGIVAGKRLVDSELTKLPQLQGPDGKFSDANYKQLLAQRQLTDAEVRDDIAQSLVAREVMIPAQFGAGLPDDVVRQYAGLLKEHRTGSIAILPSAAFAPKAPPSDADVSAYYTANVSHFIRPERRVLRYALFDDSVLKSVPAPTEAEIAARYQANKAQYAASESRTITQLILPTQDAANAVMAEVAKGTSLDAAAKARGLAVAKLPALTSDALATQTSAEVAQAAFAARRGAIAGPAKSMLGWHLLRVDTVTDKAAQSLADVHAAIAADIAATKRRAALADATARIEDEFDKGGALPDAAKELGITPQVTPQLTADGQVYGHPGTAAPKQLAKVLQAAFAMERENQPQVAEIEAGKVFILFDVTQIAPSAPAPLAEIKPDVAAALLLDKGAAAAKAAALKVLADSKKGADLAVATHALGVALPPINPISMGREQLAARQGQIPAPLALFFSMAQGTTKLLPIPQNRGWLVVQLKSIQPGVITAGDPMLAGTAKELGDLAAKEYTEQMRRAVRAEVGVSRNEVAIRAVASQLSGGN